MSRRKLASNDIELLTMSRRASFLETEKKSKDRISSNAQQPFSSTYLASMNNDQFLAHRY